MTRLIILLTVLLGHSAFAELVFEKTRIQRHATPDEKKVTVEFPFKVTGQAVRITGKEAPCTCLSAEFHPKLKGGVEKAEWKVGEEGKLVAVFEIGTFKGTQAKSVLVSHDGQKKPIELVVELTIPVALEISQATQKWKVGGPSETKIFHLEVKTDDPLSITKHHGTNPNFPYELKVLKPGRKYEVHVTPRSTSERSFGMIRLETDSSLDRYKTSQLFVVVSPQG